MSAEDRRGGHHIEERQEGRLELIVQVSAKISFVFFAMMTFYFLRLLRDFSIVTQIHKLTYCVSSL